MGSCIKPATEHCVSKSCYIRRALSYHSTLSACILLVHRVPVSTMQALAAFKRARECNPANAEAEAKLASASSTGTGDAAPKPMAGGAFLCPKPED